MKKVLIILTLILACQNLCLAETLSEEKSDKEIIEAEQIIEMEENKVVVNVLKQPMNENSKQRVILRKNWFVINIPINGKVKVNPMINQYEVE